MGSDPCPALFVCGSYQLNILTQNVYNESKREGIRDAPPWVCVGCEKSRVGIDPHSALFIPCRRDRLPRFNMLI